MAATAVMLAERPFTAIRITDIARASDIAQPNFYTYFNTIDDVVLALAQEISFEDLTRHLEPDWAGEAGVDHAARLVDAIIEMWRLHRGVLSIIGYLAERGASAFATVRVAHMRPIYKGFEDKVRRSQAAGRLPTQIKPRVAGYECVSLLTSVGERYELLRASGFSHDDLKGTTARLLHLIAMGGKG